MRGRKRGCCPGGSKAHYVSARGPPRIPDRHVLMRLTGSLTFPMFWSRSDTFFHVLPGLMKRGNRAALEHICAYGLKKTSQAIVSLYLETARAVSDRSKTQRAVARRAHYPSHYGPPPSFVTVYHVLSPRGERGGGGVLTYIRYTGMCRSEWWLFQERSLDMGPLFHLFLSPLFSLIFSGILGFAPKYSSLHCKCLNLLHGVFIFMYVNYL